MIGTWYVLNYNGVKFLIEYFWFWLSAMAGLVAIYYFSNALMLNYSGNSFENQEAYYNGFVLGGLKAVK